ncbi:unnamed protein product [Symbiodinium natans]|uniref:Uncharacterized protein n=1 Tax=Symbiodinium natans TaxID=878477 RepID=A0A812SGK6_9DINO|nr:unnamed protein product [Symbiodinium natans]
MEIESDATSASPERLDQLLGGCFAVSPWVDDDDDGLRQEGGGESSPVRSTCDSDGSPKVDKCQGGPARQRWKRSCSRWKVAGISTRAESKAEVEEKQAEIPHKQQALSASRRAGGGSFVDKMLPRSGAAIGMEVVP